MWHCVFTNVSNEYTLSIFMGGSLKMEAAGFSKFLNVYVITKRRIPKGSNSHLHSSDTFKPRKWKLLVDP
jgi:hypothetical protein